MTGIVNSGTVSLTAAFCLVVVGSSALLADGLSLPPATHPAVKKECAACHMLYPPGLLPAQSWQAITGNLADHFGDNAELDAATTKAIAEYLTANAADANGRGNKLLRGLDAKVTPARITDLPWWTRKHDKKGRIAPAALAKAGAKFKGDCKACHDGAEKGVFDDD